MTVKPTLLQRGDTIGVFAPSAPLSNIGITSIAAGVKNLRAMDFWVEFSENAVLPLTAKNSAKQRAADLMALFRDPKTKGILAVLGGYSSIELLPYLDFDVIRAHPKPFIGFSDVTALHLALHKKAGLTTFYGPTFAIFCQKNLPQYTKDHFLQMVTAGESELEPASRYADDLWYKQNTGERDWKENGGSQIVRPGAFSGEGIGGNLETLLALAGTEYFPDLRGKVLFLEEAGGKSEAEVRRKLMQLKLMGSLQELRGLLFGRFWGWTQRDQQYFLADCRDRFFAEYDFPILGNLDFGHSDPMATLPIGGTITYDNEKVRLQL